MGETKIHQKNHIITVSVPCDAKGPRQGGLKVLLRGVVRRMSTGRAFQTQSKAYTKGLWREKTEELEEVRVAGTEIGQNVV